MYVYQRQPKPFPFLQKILVQGIDAPTLVVVVFGRRQGRRRHRRHHQRQPQRRRRVPWTKFIASLELYVRRNFFYHEDLSELILPIQSVCHLLH